MGEVARELFAGSVGGAAGIVVGQPWDVVKVRVQSAPPGLYRGAWDCATKTVAADGVRGLYAGLAPPLVSMALYQSVAFAAFGAARRMMGEEDTRLSILFLAGCISGLATVPVTTPTELVKIQLQLPGAKHRDMWRCAQEIWREGGLRGLYKGTLATVLRDVPATGLYFLAYHGGKELWDESTLGGGAARELICGGLAGCLSWGSCVPFDVVKTRIQAEPQQQMPSNPFKCMAQIARAEGAGALMRGATPLVIRAFPVNAATFWVYEELMRRMR